MKLMISTVSSAPKKVQMKDWKVSSNLLNDLKLNDNEVENGHPSDKKFFEFTQKLLNAPECSADNSTMYSFLGSHRISDKMCADCVEAISGTCVETIGIERSFKVLEMFEILPCNGTDISQMLRRKLDSPRIRGSIGDDQIDRLLLNHKVLEKSIGYTFKDRAYLLQALTSPSYVENNYTPCYQKLEFLGDAVLDFLIIAYTKERCVQMDPGQLTDLRSALVNNVTLACLCVRYKIHEHILCQNETLNKSISRFSDFQHKNNNKIGDHVEFLMDDKDKECKMAEHVEVPKILADVFEAIIGAVFLDSGCNLEVYLFTS